MTNILLAGFAAVEYRPRLRMLMRRLRSSTPLTWANAITALRMAIALGILACAFGVGEMLPLVVWLAFVLAGATDAADGYVARTWRQYSAFGEYFDPVADKFLVLGYMAYLASASRQIGAFEIVCFALIAARELWRMGAALTKRGRKPVDWLGKFKMGWQIVAFGAYGLLGVWPDLDFLAAAALVVATVLTWVSFIRYMWPWKTLIAVWAPS